MNNTQIKKLEKCYEIIFLSSIAKSLKNCGEKELDAVLPLPFLVAATSVAVMQISQV